MPRKSNHIVADWISRGYFCQLLDAGVRILRYRDAMVHAKTATIDGTWSTVGTANIDRLSLTGNYEINVEIIDPGLAGALEEIFRIDESNSLELTRASGRRGDLYRQASPSSCWTRCGRCSRPGATGGYDRRERAPAGGCAAPSAARAGAGAARRGRPGPGPGRGAGATARGAPRARSSSNGVPVSAQPMSLATW